MTWMLKTVVPSSDGVSPILAIWVEKFPELGSEFVS